MTSTKPLVAWSMCLLLILASVQLLTACAKQPAESAPIKIGAFVSMTGFLTDIGNSEKDGYNYALNEAGSQVAGRNVQLVIADDASIDVPGVVGKAKKLVESDQVSLLFTPLFGASMDAILPYLETNKVPSISKQSTGWRDNNFQYHFTPAGTSAGYTYDLGLYAYDTLGYRTITLMAEDSYTSKQYVLSAAMAFKSKGGQIIQEQYAPMNTVDFGPFLSNLKKADAFMFFFPGTGAFQLVKQYRQFGVKMPILSTGDIVGEKNLAQLGDDGVGIIDETHYSISIDNAANKKFVEGYQKKYGRNPDGHDYLGYIDMSLALAALKATGGDTTPEKLVDALKKVKVDGPAGSITFGPTRYATPNMYIFQIAKKDSGYYYKILSVDKNVQLIDEATIPGLK